LDNGVPCTYEDASQLIAQYDENSNGRLSFTEFTQLALPSTNETVRELAASRDYSLYKTNSPILPPDLERLVADLIDAELNFQRVTAKIKFDLNSRVDFTTKHGFEWLDILNPLGSINRTEIKQFVELHMRLLSEEELDAIIRRCDTDGDEALSYLEFLEVVQGIQPSAEKYTVYNQVTHSPPRSPVATHVTKTVHHSPPRSPRGTVVSKTIHHSPARSPSPTHVSRTYYSPSRPQVTTTTHYSPPRAEVTTIHRSPGKVVTSHYSPPRTYTSHSPAKHTYVHVSPQRASSPFRKSITRKSPFSKTYTSFTRKQGIS